jgi:hypothetical protein
MRVELLYFEDCPNYEALLLRVRELEADVGEREEVELRRIETDDEARRQRFLGSPTVRVDGVDVDPDAAEREDFGLKCRLYTTPEGIRSVPLDDWIRSALRRSARGGGSTGAAPASGHADLWATRSVSSRLEGLTDAELDLYRSVLRSFVAGRTPTAAELERRAAEDGLQLEEALGGFERRDLLWLNPERTAVAVAYPFSGTATPHEVALVQSRTRVFAMCAIDALGIPFLTRQPAAVRSRDPITSESIEVRIDPAGERRWRPLGAVVIAGCSGEGPSSTCFCPHVHFVGSGERAKHLAAAGAPTEVFGMPEAIELGRRIFGDLLVPR